MKTNYIKKIYRKFISNFEYTVQEVTKYPTHFKFDEKSKCIKIYALCPDDAVEKYFKWHFMKYKKQSNYYTDGFISECSPKSGRIKVINNKGYEFYY